MTSVEKGARVVDMRQPKAVGTTTAASDAISKLVPVDWDRGGSSLLYVGILVRAGREQGRAA